MEMQVAVGKIAIGLGELTRQLNAFKPASVANVEDVQNSILSNLMHV